MSSLQVNGFSAASISFNDNIHFSAYFILKQWYACINFIWLLDIVINCPFYRTNRINFLLLHRKTQCHTWNRMIKLQMHVESTIINTQWNVRVIWWEGWLFNDNQCHLIYYDKVVNESVNGKVLNIYFTALQVLGKKSKWHQEGGGGGGGANSKAAAK